LDRIASRKSIEPSAELFRNTGSHGAVAHFIIGLQLKDVCTNAVVDHTGGLSAIVNGILEHINVPTVEEVAVVAVTSRITSANHERLLVAPPKRSPRVGVPDILVKDRNELNWVSVRTGPGVHVGQISHMRLVIDRVKIDAVPAGREENLSTDTIWTVVLRQIGPLSTGTGSRVVEANMRNGALFKSVSVVPEGGVASKHAETRRERLKFHFWGGIALQIVDGPASDLIDLMK